MLKRSVLIVDNSPAVTGAFKSVSSVVARLENDFDFTFCLPARSSLLHSSRMVRPAFALPFLEIRRNFSALFYIPMLLLNALRLLKYVTKRKVDIVHVNDVYNLSGIVLKLLYPRVKVVYHIRLLPTAYSGMFYNSWLKIVHRHADHIICVSNVVRKNLPESQKVSLIPDGIVFHPIERHEGKKLNGAVNLLYLANYTKGKGHDYAIIALSKALKENNSLTLLMAGGDLNLQKNRDYKSNLRRLAQQVNVTDRVEFREFEEDISSLFAEADIFLNFSDSESFSMTCLEALGNRVPVISTDSGGPAELVESGESGVIVPVGDLDAMSRAIVKMAADPVLRKRMGENGAARVQNNFDVNKTASQLKKVYDSLLAT